MGNIGCSSGLCQVPGMSGRDYKGITSVIIWASTVSSANAAAIAMTRAIIVMLMLMILLSLQ